MVRLVDADQYPAGRVKPDVDPLNGAKVLYRGRVESHMSSPRTPRARCHAPVIELSGEELMHEEPVVRLV